MLLTLIFLTLFIGIVIIFFINSENLFVLKVVSLSSASLVLFLSSLVVAFFDNNLYCFQNIVTYNINLNLSNIVYSFGLDGVSLFFFTLVAY